MWCIQRLVGQAGQTTWVPRDHPTVPPSHAGLNAMTDSRIRMPSLDEAISVQP